MKNLINDYYVKDLSKKVKSAIKSRQTQGQYISAHAIFGYMKNPEDKHKLVIDEETAPIVKMIFKFALEGLNGTQIAKRLNDLKIMTPAWYSMQSKKRNYEIDLKTVWTSAKVMKIIRDQRYVGDMVGNVRVHTKIAKSNNARVYRNDWIIVENTHEGIVSKDIFFKVNKELLPLKEREEVALGSKRRKGFCYCAECGRLLQKSNTSINPYYSCVRGNYEGTENCMNTRVSEKFIIENVSELIRIQIQNLIEAETIIKQIKLQMFKENKAEMTIEDMNIAVEKLQRSKMGLYERYRDKSITKEEYLLRKHELTMQIGELEDRKIKIVNGIGNKEEQVQLEEKLSGLIRKYKNKREFSYEDISELVSKVIVNDEKRIEIVWDFKDLYDGIIRLMLQQIVLVSG